VVALNGFQDDVRDQQRALLSSGVPLQLWDRSVLLQHVDNLADTYPINPEEFQVRNYQEEAIRSLMQAYLDGHVRKALIVMATGLGKTFVAAESIRRLNSVLP